MDPNAPLKRSLEPGTPTDLLILYIVTACARIDLEMSLKKAAQVLKGGTMISKEPLKMDGNPSTV